ncbi:hypothetical protein HRbin41_00420 [bacterium HR41]|nr:hypothetical protein HRbin41_00420 [bacterium HR41]
MLLEGALVRAPNPLTLGGVGATEAANPQLHRLEPLAGETVAAARALSDQLFAHVVPSAV